MKSSNTLLIMSMPLKALSTLAQTVLNYMLPMVICLTNFFSTQRVTSELVQLKTGQDLHWM
jgi:hypothetical protein